MHIYCVSGTNLKASDTYWMGPTLSLSESVHNAFSCNADNPKMVAKTDRGSFLSSTENPGGRPFKDKATSQRCSQTLSLCVFLFLPLTRRFVLMVATWLLYFQRAHLYSKWTQSLLLPRLYLFSWENPSQQNLLTTSWVRIMSHGHHGLESVQKCEWGGDSEWCWISHPIVFIILPECPQGQTDR